MVEVEFNTARLEKAFRKFPGVLRRELDDGFDMIGKSFMKKFWQERLQGNGRGVKSSGKGKGSIFNRFQRIKIAPTHNLEDMGTEIYADSKIVALHETGGEIRGSGGGDLAIPFSKRIRPEMYKARGGVRKPFKKPGKLKKLRLVKLKGKGFLAKEDSSGNIKPMFVLKNKVLVRPRLGFFKTVDAHAGRRIQILNKKITKAIEIGYYGP